MLKEKKKIGGAWWLYSLLHPHGTWAVLQASLSMMGQFRHTSICVSILKPFGLNEYSGTYLWRLDIGDAAKHNHWRILVATYNRSRSCKKIFNDISISINCTLIMNQQLFLWICLRWFCLLYFLLICIDAKVKLVMARGGPDSCICSMVTGASQGFSWASHR